MGFVLSWVAIRGVPAETLLPRLGLKRTGRHEDDAESPLVIASLSMRWTLFLANDDMRFEDDEHLKTWTAGAEAVSCSVDEHSMTSRASGWRNGRILWDVVDLGSGTGLKVTGGPPLALAAIRKAQKKKQATGSPDVDYVFDVPVDLARLLVGYRYDEIISGLTFEVLEEA